jgi:hypothetical protein
MSIKIPPAALEAGARAMAKAGYDFAAIEITDPYTADADYWNHTARAACLAMLAAWPGMREGFGTDNQGHYDTIILPLTEASDE